MRSAPLALGSLGGEPHLELHFVHGQGLELADQAAFEGDRRFPPQLGEAIADRS